MGWENIRREVKYTNRSKIFKEINHRLRTCFIYGIQYIKWPHKVIRRTWLLVGHICSVLWSLIPSNEKAISFWSVQLLNFHGSTVWLPFWSNHGWIPLASSWPGLNQSSVSLVSLIAIDRYVKLFFKRRHVGNLWRNCRRKYRWNARFLTEIWRDGGVDRVEFGRWMIGLW